MNDQEMEASTIKTTYNDYTPSSISPVDCLRCNMLPLNTGVSSRKEVVGLMRVQAACRGSETERLTLSYEDTVSTQTWHCNGQEERCPGHMEIRFARSGSGKVVNSVECSCALKQGRSTIVGSKTVIRELLLRHFHLHRKIAIVDFQREEPVGWEGNVDNSKESCNFANTKKAFGFFGKLRDGRWFGICIYNKNKPPEDKAPVWSYDVERMATKPSTPVIEIEDEDTVMEDTMPPFIDKTHKSCMVCGEDAVYQLICESANKELCRPYLCPPCLKQTYYRRRKDVDPLSHNVYLKNRKELRKCPYKCDKSYVTHKFYLKDEERNLLPVSHPIGWVHGRPVETEDQKRKAMQAFDMFARPLHKKMGKIEEELQLLQVELQEWTGQETGMIATNESPETLQQLILNHTASIEVLEAELRELKFPKWVNDWTMASPIPTCKPVRITLLDENSVVEIDDSSMDADTDDDDETYMQEAS